MYPHYLIKGTFFGKKKLLNIKCVFLSEAFLILRKIHVKHPLFLPDFNLSRQIFEKYSNIKFMEIGSVGAELFHADGQTDRQTDRQIDMTKLIVDFQNFAKGPKN
jgi:hypothetical protein